MGRLEQLLKPHDEPLKMHDRMHDGMHDEMHARYLSGYIAEARMFRPEIGHAISFIAARKQLPYRAESGDANPTVVRLLELLDRLGFAIQIVPKDDV
jgi:hypothetical protein